MTHVTCRLTAKNGDQLRNPTLGNRAWASFTVFTVLCRHQPGCSRPWPAVDGTWRPHHHPGRPSDDVDRFIPHPQPTLRRPESSPCLSPDVRKAPSAGMLPVVVVAVVVVVVVMLIKSYVMFAAGWWVHLLINVWRVIHTPFNGLFSRTT